MGRTTQKFLAGTAAGAWTSRRSFLQGWAAAATLGWLATDTVSARADVSLVTTSVRARHIERVLIDERVTESAAFGRELATRGARILSVQEDIGRLWRNELAAVCAAGGAIAGLTSHADLFVADMSARQLGARVRFQGQHDCRGLEILTHSLRLHWELRGLGTHLARANARWPEALATQLAEMPPAIDDLIEERVRTDTRRSASHPGSLFSWLIA